MGEWRHKGLGAPAVMAGTRNPAPATGDDGRSDDEASNGTERAAAAKAALCVAAVRQQAEKRAGAHGVAASNAGAFQAHGRLLCWLQGAYDHARVLARGPMSVMTTCSHARARMLPPFVTRHACMHARTDTPDRDLVFGGRCLPGELPLSRALPRSCAARAPRWRPT